MKNGEVDNFDYYVFKSRNANSSYKHESDSDNLHVCSRCNNADVPNNNIVCSGCWDEILNDFTA